MPLEVPVLRSKEGWFRWPKNQEFFEKNSSFSMQLYLSQNASKQIRLLFLLLTQIKAVVNLVQRSLSLMDANGAWVSFEKWKALQGY